MPNLKLLPGPRIFRPHWYARILPKSVHPLCKVVWNLMKLERMTMRDLCHKSGINENTIRGWFKITTNSPTLQNIEACLGTFELTIIAIPSEWLDPHMNSRSITDVRALERMVERAKAVQDEEVRIEKQITVREKPKAFAY